MDWYDKYYIESTLSNVSRLNDYVNKLSNKTEEKNIENKVGEIEESYNNKLKEIENLCKNESEIDVIKQKPSLVILQKELEIIRLLTKYTLQNKDLNYNFFISCLEMLFTLSETLRKRLNQKDIIADKQSKNNELLATGNIFRCSYKFCSYKDNCSYNYNLKTKNLCYQDHYVHNMVSADLKILIDYVKSKNINNNNTVAHNKEILKTINTLSFVIGHMETELKTKCFYLPENEWDSCHIVKNLIN